MRAITVVLILLLAGNVFASDHLDSQYLDELPRLDIGDLFVWTGRETNSPVFLISLNPLTLGEQPVEKLLLDPHALDEFKIDTDNDYRADIAYKLSVSGNAHPQEIVLYRAIGAEAEDNTLNKGTMSVIAKGQTTIPGKEPSVVSGGGGELLFVGARQDPFFFNFEKIESPVALDLRFALGADGLPSDGTAKNTFGPTNIAAIVLEVPELRGKKFGMWATTSIGGEQVDRCGRASITAIFIPNTPPGRNPEYYTYNNPRKPGSQDPQDRPKQIYNTTRPAEDRENYGDLFRKRLRQLQASNVEELVAFFLPDIQGYDPTQQMGYPNGRNLEEDAVFWTIKKINPFLAPEGTPLPYRNTQPLSDRFPYAAVPVDF